MKKCRVCNGDLIVGENITNARFSNRDYICSLDLKLYNRKKYGKYGDKVGKPRIHDPSTYKQRIKEGRLRSRHKYPAGIYCFKEDGEIVYIGESIYPARRREGHLFSNRSRLKEELKGCEWEMMEEVDDKHQRKVREFELIYQHKPKYNFPYRI